MVVRGRKQLALVVVDHVSGDGHEGGQLVFRQGAVDLVGADVEEFGDAFRLGDIEQDLRADGVGVHDADPDTAHAPGPYDALQLLVGLAAPAPAGVGVVQEEQPDRGGVVVGPAADHVGAADHRVVPVDAVDELVVVTLAVGQDRRRREVSLTAKGQRMLAEGWALWRQAQDGFERDAGFAPGFDEGPVEGREQEQRAAAALEVLFDFGEVVEVILHNRPKESMKNGANARNED